jgi:hypothetical protein
LVASGQIRHKVVGVHILQVTDVSVRRATVFLVTGGIPRCEVEKVGLKYAVTPQEALDEAFKIAGGDASVLVLHGAGEMLPAFQSEDS